MAANKSHRRATFQELVDKDIDEEQSLEILPVECVIHVEKIMCLLENITQELKATCLVPMMIRNPHTTRLSLEGTEFEEFSTILQNYLNKKNRGEFVSIAPENNIYLARMFDYIHENPAIVRALPPWTLTEKLSNALTKENFTSALDSLDSLIYLSKMNLFRAADMVLEKEKLMHKMYEESEKLKAHTKGLRSELEKTKATNAWALAAKGGVLKKMQTDMDFKRIAEEKYVNQKIYHLNKNARQKYIEQEKVAAKAEEDYLNTQKQYETVCRKNEIAERDARAERNKIQLQLLALIKKHDQNITMRFREHLYLIDEFDETQEKFEIFMQTYAIEEEQWNQLVKEKQEREERERLGRQALYAMNRAARVIQNYWRKWRKGQKKKAGKLGKKKKK